MTIVTFINGRPMATLFGLLILLKIAGVHGTYYYSVCRSVQNSSYSLQVQHLDGTSTKLADIIDGSVGLVLNVATF